MLSRKQSFPGFLKVSRFCFRQIIPENNDPGACIAFQDWASERLLRVENTFSLEDSRLLISSMSRVLELEARQTAESPLRPVIPRRRSDSLVLTPGPKLLHHTNE